MNHIQRAVDLKGGYTRLAKIVGVTPQAVRFWRDAQRRIPAEVCIVIDRETCGAVTCEQLRPDVDWAYLRTRPKSVGLEQEPAHA